ncbi:putative HTH-type transcriptional regulator [uncultured archaeon]|nr:putative HTH-type transcriptional regulator [uncultured archaeon]
MQPAGPTGLDKLDRSILHLLDQDSRAPYSKLARRLHTSPQVVKYRVEKLYERQLLLACWPMVEYRGLGYFFGLHFIKLQNLTPKEEEKFYAYLHAHPYIPIVMRAQGYADLILAIDGRGIHHLSEIVRELQNRFSTHFLDWDTVIPIGFSRFNRNYLVGEKDPTPDVAFTGAQVSLETDETDRKLLCMLNHDARTPLSHIAKKAGVSAATAAQRIKRLEKGGVIQCYTILPDHVKLGWPRHRVLIKFKNLTEEQERRFFSYCNLHPHIVHHIKCLGNWDCAIDIEIETGERLREVLMDIKSKFSEVVQRIEPSYIYKIDRFRDIPDEFPQLNK